MPLRAYQEGLTDVEPQEMQVVEEMTIMQEEVEAEMLVLGVLAAEAFKVLVEIQIH
jgi:hypothetical protein